MTHSHPQAETRHRPDEVVRMLLRKPMLRNIFFTCLVVALLFPLYNWFWLRPSYRGMITQFSEEDARRAARHLIRMLQVGDLPIDEKVASAGIKQTIADLQADFKLEKLRIYAPDGRAVFSTAPSEIGTRNTQPYFLHQVARGLVRSRMVRRGLRTGETRMAMRDVVEIHVPVMRGAAFLGAFEIYYDVTDDKQRLDSLLRRSGITQLCIALFMIVISTAALYKTAGTMLSHRKVDAALRNAREELEQRVRERTEDLIEANKELQMEIIERRQAESNLRESERRFRTLVETIPYGIQEIDAQGRITFANPAHGNIYGVEARDLLGRSMFEFTADDGEREQLKEHLAYVLEHQPHPNPWFGRQITADGRLIDTQVDWNYKRDLRGRVEGLITVISEITHRKRAEKALEDNFNFMNTLIDTIPNPVFYKDKEGLFLGCNVAFAQTLGLTKEGILGHRLVDLESSVTRKMARRYHEQDMQLIRNPGIQTHEEKVLCADGVTRIYVLSKATFSDAEDQVAGLVAIMLDITERKQAEKALQESKALFDAFMHHLPGLAFMKDPQGRYIYVNEAFSQFTDIDLWDQIGRNDDQLWDVPTAQTIQANDRQVLESRRAVSQMETVRLPDRQERHLLTARFPVFQDGDLSAIGGISIDVTERTNAQRQREQLELQLQQTQKMEALGTLAGGIAHDFNNILAAIIGYTEIVAAGLDKAGEAHDYLSRVLEAGERARSLVKQILAFSRQGEMEPKPVQVKLIVKEVLKLLRASLPATIEIDQQLTTSGAVMADPIQLHQVMMNLGTNAGYAMGEKGGKLTVTLKDVQLDEAFARQHQQVLPGPHIRLSVGDTGPGIDPTQIDRIFDPFFTTKPKGEGTGMGLAVVHGIVTGLKGTITVASQPGRGARFDVFLPSLEGEAATAATRAEALPVGKERILYVDDEVFQTDMLTHMLGLLGYKVQSCNDGNQAVELFEMAPEAFDLVITDMIMPGMTGDVLAGQILAIRPDLPIIMATGYSENMSEAKAKAIGIRAYALKPLVMEELARLIRDVLDADAT